MWNSEIKVKDNISIDPCICYNTHVLDSFSFKIHSIWFKYFFYRIIKVISMNI